LAVLEGATKTEDLAGQEPVDETKSVLTLVVGGDSNINVLEKRVGVSKGDDGDVDIGSLLDGLEISAGISADDEAGLLEGTGDVVSEGTGGETADDSFSTNVLGELQGSTVTVGTSRDDNDVLGLLNDIEVLD
jgi:hypothetical protein